MLLFLRKIPFLKLAAKFLVIIVFFQTGIAWSDRPQCIQSVVGAQLFNLDFSKSKRSLNSIRTLKIGTYNVLNLFENVGKHLPNDYGYSLISPPEAIALNHIQNMASVFQELNLDIAILQEIEGGLVSMEKFNKKYLSRNYRAYLIDGNDPRGINIGFYIKSDLPINVELHTHKNLTWLDPTKNEETLLFTRDLPIAILRDNAKSKEHKPLMILVGTHGKSMRDRAGDPQSKILRTAQFKKTAEIILDIQARYGKDTPLFLAGDFNTFVKGPEAASLYEKSKLIEAFDTLPVAPPKMERITHTYHPKTNPVTFITPPTEAEQIDGILVSESAKKFIKKAEVYRYKDARTGEIKKIPQTIEERKENPSDHFPLIITTDFKSLYQDFLKNN